MLGTKSSVGIAFIHENRNGASDAGFLSFLYKKRLYRRTNARSSFFFFLIYC